jgi:chaperonin GroEL
MAKNAGLSADVLMKEVIESKKDKGWDFRKNELVNMFSAGIIDPVKVTKAALRNASSCAGTLMTTNYGVVQTGDK